MADEYSSISDLLTEAPSDYAISALEKLFGGIIPYISGDAETFTGTANFLTNAIMMMNAVCAISAVILGLYSLLSLLAESASDGQILGRSADTKFTLLRAAAAALLFTPISGGFAVVQLIAFSVGVFGTQLANTGWEAYTEFALSDDESGVFAADMDLGDEAEWQMRGKLAMATYTMMVGKLCQLHLDRLSESYDVDAKSSPVQAPRTVTADGSLTTSASETKVFEMYYKTGSGADVSNDICGSLRYSVSYAADDDETDENTATLRSISDDLDAIVKDQQYSQVVSALQTMKTSADSLAEKIYSGNPSDTDANLRNNATVDAKIKEIAETAVDTITSNRDALSLSTSETQELQTALSEAMNKNGWFMAPIWQRGLASVYTKIREAQTNLNMDFSIEHRIQSIFGTGAYGFFFSDNGVSRASFAPVERDFEYLANQLPFVLKLSQPDADSNTNPLGADAGAAMGQQALRGIYTSLLKRFDVVKSDTFSDPFVGYAEVGSDLMYTAAGVLGGGSLLEGITADIPILGSMVAQVAGPVKALGYYTLVTALAFGLFIPMVPIFYFMSAVLSWLVLVLEAVFALPLALLMWMVPAREPSMIGPWNKVMLTIVNLLLRPLLIVVGLICCSLVLWIANMILGVIFENLLMVTTPDWTLTSVAMVLGLTGLYAYASILIALHTSSIITFFSDAVMNWIGGVVSSPLNKDGMGERLNQSTYSSTPMPGVGSFSPAPGKGLGFVAGRELSRKLRNRRGPQGPKDAHRLDKG